MCVCVYRERERVIWESVCVRVCVCEGGAHVWGGFLTRGMRMFFSLSKRPSFWAIIAPDEKYVFFFTFYDSCSLHLSVIKYKNVEM